MRLHSVVRTTAWLVSSAFVAAPAAGLGGQATAPIEQRRFLGPAGVDLPFDSDEAVLEFLASAEIVSRNRIPVGVTRPQAVMLERDGIQARATFKDIDETYERVRMSDGSYFMNLRDYYGFEQAAYELARTLGLDNVPPTAIRRFGRSGASLQLWIENTMTETDRAQQALRPPRALEWMRQLQTMYLFDDLIGNVDRNAGDIVIDRDSWKLWLIDHSRAFQRHVTLAHADELSFCRRDVWEGLRGLDKDDVTRRLGLSLTQYEIDALFARRDALVDHIQGLIESRGEDVVLYQD